MGLPVTSEGSGPFMPLPQCRRSHWSPEPCDLGLQVTVSEPLQPLRLGSASCVRFSWRVPPLPPLW